MSTDAPGPGWWVASDGRWYAPELHPARAAPAPAPGFRPPAAWEAGRPAGPAPDSGSWGWQSPTATGHGTDLGNSYSFGAGRSGPVADSGPPSARRGKGPGGSRFVPRLVVVVVVVVAFGGLYAAITRVAPSIGLPGSPDVGAHSSPDAVTADLLGKMYGSTSSGLGTEQTSATDIAPADRAAFAAGWTGSTAMPMNGISNAVADAGATSGTIEAVAVTQSQTTSTGTGTATVTMTVEVAMWTTDADATTANPHVLEHVTLDAVQVDGQWYVAYPWG